jgi:hypothetical protein
MENKYCSCKDLNQEEHFTEKHVAVRMRSHASSSLLFALGNRKLRLLNLDPKEITFLQEVSK